MFTPKALPNPIPLSAHPAGIGVVDVTPSTIPLKVLIGPVGLQSQDRIDLYWGQHLSPVASYTHPFTEPDASNFATLSVDTRWIQSEESPVPLRYTFTPFPGGSPENSDITHVRVKLEIPGGIDIDPATPHENEALALPTMFPTGIITRPSGVSVTVKPYVNMATGDVIRVTWQGQDITHPALTPIEVGKEVVIPIPAWQFQIGRHKTRKVAKNIPNHLLTS